MPFVVLLVFLLGCQAADSPAAYIREVCPFGPAPGPVPYPSDTCLASVLEAYRVDLDAFAAVGEGPDLEVFLAAPDEAVWATRLGGLLIAAREVLTRDLGPLADGNLHFETRLRAVARRTGARSLGDALFDYTTLAVDLTLPGEGPALASMWPRDRTLVLHGPMNAYEGVGVLVHEARHADLRSHVPCPWDPALGCDEGPGGAHGFQLAVNTRLLETAEDPVAIDTLQAWSGLNRRRILPVR